MTARHRDLRSLDQALIGLRRFLAAPQFLDDEGRAVELSTLLVLDGLPEDGQSVRDVAARLAVAHSTASRFVTRAERAGTVARSSAQHDTRQVRVVATPEGRALADRATAFRLARLAHLLDGWSGEDVHTLAVSLSRFAAASTPR
ncbi:MarR family transcriptional regulator [Isoptericola jiangsuensis]|uniref:MarR family transcriptional regulator n=1 Tax=Isoptericola jiangsuensis TaxID=548579 RepID=A0A2A9EXS6_9MICO|nr:MarR family transcriptional regulator [Isoptericola jiangsuensis]PFG43366.1 MarR family transcriptional regulator [Isoptericola jiangsuensis]